MIEWATIFPLMGEVQATNDPRIFHTKFIPDSNKKKASKTKSYFCYIIGKDGYKVDVTRQWAKDAVKECDEAYFKVKAAADFYESHGEWPQE